MPALKTQQGTKKIKTSGLSLSCITVNKTPGAAVHAKDEGLDVTGNFKYIRTAITWRHR